MKSKLSVVKIGGNIIDQVASLDVFLKDLAKIPNPKILIHGGGKRATYYNQRLGVETIMHEGRRITTTESLDTVTMVYAGLINKTIVSTLQKYNCNAIGLSGCDADCILAEKRPSAPVDYGWVGDIVSVNADMIQSFIENSITPVFSAISHDGKGQLLNTNADTIASEVAIAMSRHYDVELIYCFEKKGVLLDIENDNSVIKRIDKKRYEALKEDNIIHEGMLPKMKNCFHALENHVAKVIIGDTKVICESSDLFTTLEL